MHHDSAEYAMQRLWSRGDRCRTGQKSVL